ncbi:hypothetical protein HAX54_031509 [Datura stramonium]|uniref:Amidohydrolase-related domain-containing protein n=1 Tax=Datura stramonium TaxID=4076 RepID=A0ABS8RGM5_DATST|nr:hypothetical protein [Datura stramonium]
MYLVLGHLCFCSFAFLLTALFVFFFWHRGLRELTELYGPSLSLSLGLHTAQETRRSLGLEQSAITCFRAARICAVLIDDGIELHKMVDIEWHKIAVPMVGRILRVEHLAEKILDKVLLTRMTTTVSKILCDIVLASLLEGNNSLHVSGTASCLLEMSYIVKKSRYSCFQPEGVVSSSPMNTKGIVKHREERKMGANQENESTIADKVVAFKRLVACRSGLAINTEVTKNEAEEGLSDVLRNGNPLRISNKSFIDYIFMHALEVAQSYDLTMQIHMGFGDKDFDMMLANPLYLHNLLEDKRFTNSRLVLLHASYPFSKEASHLASAYPQVFLDFGFAIPKLSFHGMISSVKELLELAPMNKFMFSTDAIAFAEAF